MYKSTTDISEVKAYLADAKVVAFDFETAPDEQYRNEERAALDPHKAHIVGVSFSVAEGSGIYVPIEHYSGENAWQPGIWALLQEFATNPNIVKVAHNLAFESMFLYARGIVVQAPVYDTIAASQLTLKANMMLRNLGESGLKTLVPELLGISLPSFATVTAGRHFDELDPSDAETVRYACADSDYTLRLYHLFNNWFDRHMPPHRVVVERVESPAAVYCGLMKYNGLLMDAELMRQKVAECEKQVARLKEEIAAIIGDVNIGANASTSAFKQYLYKDLGLPVLKTTAKYQEAADDEAMVLLSEWCAVHRPELAPLFKLIQDYRRWGKIKSTYIDGYAQHINSVTGRIHPDLMPMATETGRFACRKSNLQNCPRAGADDIGVRNFILAPEGKSLLSLDFSQIELRVGAFYCRDRRMMHVYRTGGDIHDQTASVIFGPGKHNKEQRTIAKNVNFGTFFGLYPKGLQRTLKFKAGLDKPLSYCEEILYNLKHGYPTLPLWQKDTISKARSNRYSQTWMWRRRYLSDISVSDWSKRSFFERCALNTPIQGTAADILKLALGRIIAGLSDRPWLRPLLQIHDELVFELPTERVAEEVAFIKACMEAQPFPDFDLPIIAEAAVGARFGEMTEVEDSNNG